MLINKGSQEGQSHYEKVIRHVCNFNKNYIKEECLYYTKSAKSIY
jgi:hypothetical protein